MSVYHGPLSGERLIPAHADALVHAFGGIGARAEQIATLFPELAAADPDAGMVDPATVAQALDHIRWPGLRDMLTALHPVTMALRAALTAAPDKVPAPDPEIVTLLSEQPGFALTGAVASINGVPLPAGAPQTRYFVALRWRSLFSPFADLARVWCGDLRYDAAMTTDELQESLLLVSTRLYRDALTLLQRTAPALFVALWLRDGDAIDRLVAATPADALPDPYPRSRIRNPGKCLLIMADAMSEWERAFDLLGALKFDGGVTFRSVKAALVSTTSMTRIRAVPDATHRHVAGGAAHTRTIHPTINGAFVDEQEPDPVLAAVRHGFEASRVYQKRYRHVVWVAGEMPTRYFLGVEPAMLIPVALLQMRETVAVHEGQFWLGARGAQDSCKDAGTLATRLMSLAVIVTSTICVPTARAMMHDDGLLRATPWLVRAVAPLIVNPAMEEELARTAKRADDRCLHSPAVTQAPLPDAWVGGRETFKNSFAMAKLRAAKCSPPIGEPGWTGGFRQDAWRQPHAEIEFLRDCTTLVRYRKELVPREEQWRAVLDARGRAGCGIDALATIDTGLPQQHPLMRVQGLFHDQLQRLQLAGLAWGVESLQVWLLREALIRQVAPLLATLNPTSDDPQLNERFWTNLQSADVHIAVHGAWNV